MSEPLLLDIIVYFKNKKLVVDDGIDTFRDFSPNEPDDAVVLFEYAGSPQSPIDNIVHRSVQVTARSKSADKARSKAVDLYRSLVPEVETLRLQFTKDRWGQVHLRQPPSLMRRDELGRSVYFFNLGITTNLD